MIAEASVLRGRRRGNLVIFGSDQPLPEAALGGRRPATRSRRGWWPARTCAASSLAHQWSLTLRWHTANVTASPETSPQSTNW